MKRPLSISRRLALSLTAALFVFWLLAVAIGTHVMRHELDEMFDGSLAETTQRLFTLVSRSDLPANLNTDLNVFSYHGHRRRQYLIYQLRNASGQVVIRSSDAPKTPFDVPLKPGFFNTPTHRVFTETSADGKLFLQVGDAFRNRREAEREGGIWLLLPLLVLIPVGILGVLLIVRYGLRPVETLRHDILQKGTGNLRPLDEDKVPVELRPVVTSVNRLLERLSMALEAEREFTATSAHELRTPVAGALAQTQLLVAQLAPGDDRRRAQSIEASLAALSRLIGKLLQLSRAEAGIGATEKTVDLKPVLAIVVEEFQRERDYRERIVLTMPEEVRLRGPIDRDAFGIAIRNLIENALNYGDKEQPVEVLVTEDNVVRIINGGSVIPAEQLSQLTRRFQRGSGVGEGSGLGLSIVDRLVHQMNGTLLLRSPATGRADGFEARIQLSATVSGSTIL